MKHKFIFYFVFGLILTACSNAPAYTDMISPTKDAYCTHGNITHNIPPEIIETTDINDTLQTPQMDNDGQPSEDNWAVTIMHMSNEMELYAFWFMTPFMDGLAVYVDEFMLEKNNFLQTFNAYTRIGEPSENDLSWVVFSANTDLYDFQFFTISLACAPWTDYDWTYYHTYPDYFYYMTSSAGLLDGNLPLGDAVIVHWSTSYIFAHAGVSFFDETRRRRYVTLRVNVGDYGSPLILDEIAYFGNSADCPLCAK